MGPRLVVWGLGLAVMAFTALANYKTMQAQTAFRNEMDKRLTNYVSKEQWQERWDGHSRDQKNLRDLIDSVEEAIRSFNSSSGALNERMARLEALLGALEKRIQQ